jgi:hypothetical protein
MGGLFGDNTPVAPVKTPFADMPVGVYKTYIVHTETGELSGNKGKKLTIWNMVVEGPLTGRWFQKIHSYDHINSVARKLARQDIAAIAKCVGYDLTENIENNHYKLRGKPILVEITHQHPVNAKPWDHTEPTAYGPWCVGYVPKSKVLSVLDHYESQMKITRRIMEAY